MNRLTRAEGVDGKTADYVYSGLGHQVGKHISDAKNPMKSISFVLDLTREYHNLLQTTGEDGQIKNYIWDFNVLYEQNAPVNKSNSITNSVDDSGGTGTGDIVTDSVSRFYLQDDLGSTLRLTGTDSILISSFAYDEFGNNLTGYQNETQPFGFACEYFDSGSGLYNLQARHYNPLVGRMISEDPICGDILNPLSLNLYAYCHNDPVNFIDPGGMLDVMVKYIVEKNSGKIKNKYTIKIGNITKKYKKKDFKIIRGQLVIDNKKLMKDFCLTKAQSLHKEGDPFKTANHAAMAFGFRISPKAIKKDIEYGANIYKKSGSYTYKDVVSGTVASVTLKAVNSNYGTRVAYIHTHGGYTKGYVGTDFSTQDKKVAKWNNINAYLMTPNGYLLKYYKNQKKVIPLAKNMPYDKKYYKK
jgi:RHS repeat-associated protein